MARKDVSQTEAIASYKLAEVCRSGGPLPCLQSVGPSLVVVLHSSVCPAPPPVLTRPHAV